MPAPFQTSRTQWREIVLTCRKCQKKLGGGFGPARDLTLRKALRKFMGLTKGRKAAVSLRDTGCLDVCPKRAVACVVVSRPGEVVVVPAGAELAEVRARLGLTAAS